MTDTVETRRPLPVTVAAALASLGGLAHTALRVLALLARYSVNAVGVLAVSRVRTASIPRSLLFGPSTPGARPVRGAP